MRSQVVAGGREVFRWFADGTIESLSTPTDVSGFPTAVSDDGAIVTGRAIIPGGMKRAHRWDTSGTPLDISLPGAFMSVPVGMSRDGQIIALINEFPNGDELGAIWTQSLGTVAIPPINGHTQTEIIVLSDDGSTALALPEPNPTPSSLPWILGSKRSCAYGHRNELGLAYGLAETTTDPCRQDPYRHQPSE